MTGVDVSEKAGRIHLIASDETEPKVRLAVGKRYQVIATTVVDHDLNEVAGEVDEPRLRSPRLCGSRSTCVAIVETADE
jgi:hypothetical protein